MAAPHVESVLSSDPEFISTEDEESFGLLASTGDENSEVINNDNCVLVKIFKQRLYQKIIVLQYLGSEKTARKRDPL